MKRAQEGKEARPQSPLGSMAELRVDGSSSPRSWAGAVTTEHAAALASVRHFPLDLLDLGHV